jgi:pimeloyl-ACP methyl ester carboxylesterase
MTAIVLAAGTWHGGWAWRRVAPRLRVAGHAVYTPTFTGLGERAHLLTPEVGLETHIQDLLAVLHYEDLRDSVLVGHTSGAQVAVAAAARAPERVVRLVAIDGLVPAAGQSQFDTLPAPARAHWEALVRERGRGWQMPPHDEADLDIPDEADRRWVAARLTPHPWRAFCDRQPEAAAGATAVLPRTHFSCVVEQGPVMAGGAARAQATGWEVRELPAGTAAMITAPEAVTAAILSLV